MSAKRTISIASNLAEGQGRGTVAYGLHFLRIALGSAAQVNTLLELARRLRFVTADSTQETDRQLERVRQMLYGLRREHQRRLVVTGAKATSVLLILLTAVSLFV